MIAICGGPGLAEAILDLSVLDTAPISTRAIIVRRGGRQASTTMIAVGDGRVEPRTASGLLPSYCVENPAVSSIISPSTLSPAATVCKDDDVMSDKTAPEFKLSQCFGDCSPAEEATQGERCVFKWLLPRRAKTDLHTFQKKFVVQ